MIRRAPILLICHLMLLTGLRPQPVHAEDTLPGRLFFTPAERRAIEHAHQHPAQASVDAADSPPEVIRFDGMVWRKEQLVALWINRKGRAADRHHRPDPNTGQLQITDPNGLLGKLHAGQYWPPSIINDRAVSIRIERSRGDEGQ